MKKSITTNQNNFSAKRRRAFRAGVFMCILLAAGAVTAIAKYESGSGGVASSHAEQSSASAQPTSNYVSIEVGGKKLKVNAQTLQQGPLTPEQSRQLANALTNNKSSDGLVQVQQADGTVSVDLEGRFQNVMIAKKSDDGSVTQACVDNSEAAAAFLKSGEATADSSADAKAGAKK